MLKIKNFCIILTTSILLSPTSVLALEMPKNSVVISEVSGIAAKSYLVMDEQSGKVIVAKDADIQWPPASLTKLMTAMVVLDINPKLSKIVSMAASDEVGGARLKTKASVKYRQKDLFFATLVASANNAANALARSTGLSRERFVEKMNQKAQSLGAENTWFLEPAGIDEHGTATALDFAKIAAAAFKYPLIVKASETQNHSFSAVNNRRFRHNLKSTNKLLGDGEVKILAGKTGYLDESQYNFVAKMRVGEGPELIVAVFGSSTSKTQFADSKNLAIFADGLQAGFGGGAVLGVDTEEAMRPNN